MPSVLTVTRWEARKLVSQKRTYLGLAAAVGAPLLFVGALAVQNGAPTDEPFGASVRSSGLAIPLLMLVFGSIWLFPLIAALVAGDIVASEDQNGTLKTILTRSLNRGHIFAGKVVVAVAYATFAITLMVVTAIAAGSIQSGFNPLRTLTGTEVSAGRATLLVFVSLAVYLMPLAAVVAIGVMLSTLTRNSAGAVVGTLMLSLLMQLIGVLPGFGGVRPYLLTTQFDAWQGLLREPIDTAPIVHAAWICPLYAVPALAIAYIVFQRRDVAGG
ncbi:MAG: type transport system permease protein [Gaiellaceae bacterium]|jgi:ABC-2 type transport system permease protein|nr:type transport system permease protein [Gaiellaceae bacterium]